ncbi:MAG: alpha/beta hydrolase [Candidatus Limnocylindrales bacterium]
MIGAIITAIVVAGCAGTGTTPTVVVRQSASPSPTAVAAPSATPRPSAGQAPSDATSIMGTFDVGGRSLFLECRGTGSPAVIFLVGTDAPRTQMRTVEDELLDRPVTVCDYDRAGAGQSDPAPKRQTDVDVVDDLAALLASAKVPSPYVFVGQSVGGDQAWLYADRHPAGVAALLIMNAGFFQLDWSTLTGVWSDDEIAAERALSEASLGMEKQAATPPDGVPYVVMMSSIAQCDSPTDVCGRIYPFFEAWGRELASRTPDGRFVEVEAQHEIFDGSLPTVMQELHELLDKTKQ